VPVVLVQIVRVVGVEIDRAVSRRRPRASAHRDGDSLGLGRRRARRTARSRRRCVALVAVVVVRATASVRVVDLAAEMSEDSNRPQTHQCSQMPSSISQLQFQQRETLSSRSSMPRRRTPCSPPRPSRLRAAACGNRPPHVGSPASRASAAALLGLVVVAPLVPTAAGSAASLSASRITSDASRNE